jgi:prophage maintenance system killer protein
MMFDMVKQFVPTEDRVVFVVPKSGNQIDVKITMETAWLSVAQMSALFGRDMSVIRRHVRNVFAEKEVSDSDSYRQILPVTSPGGGRPEPIYSLDVIISVGYRVKSQRGVEFRQWATRVLKERLISDYRRRADEASSVLAGIRNIELLARDANSSHPQEAEKILGLIQTYARSWRILLQYDEKRLPPPPEARSKRMARLTPGQATAAVQQFRQSLSDKGEATAFFGKDHGDGLASILQNIEQTWDGAPVYPNVEIRAAHLLYFVIKNHPFLDGNKRIGSLLFLHYLDKNRRALMEQNALVALALLVAESDPKHKDVVIRLIISLMQQTTEPTP